MSDGNIAAAAAVLHAMAIDLAGNPPDAIGALTAALGSMIATNALDGQRVHAHEACDLMCKMLKEGTDRYFDILDEKRRGMN